jgi:hypothetical protein
MDNKNENEHGDVDIGAWNKMCRTVSDVRKILRVSPRLCNYAHVMTLDISALISNLKIVCIWLVVGEE